ncbi:uncharacterized protein LOC143465650 [Clavelina lepadiformis]|uniref:uncharacterized protein LOC143465650 n=1 Tax=Clavelina lepadiformis TaxID=159417 RepID=UPI004041816C
MSFLKILVIVLLSIATLGTIINWVLKIEEEGVKVTERNTQIRIEQIREECKRQIVENEEFFKQKWEKQTKEFENHQTKELNEQEDQHHNEIAEADRAHNTAMDLLKEQNEKLRIEKEHLHLKLLNITKHYNQYKSQMEGIGEALRFQLPEENLETENKIDDVTGGREETKEIENKQPITDIEGGVQPT